MSATAGLIADTKELNDGLGGYDSEVFGTVTSSCESTQPNAKNIKGLQHHKLFVTVEHIKINCQKLFRTEFNIYPASSKRNQFKKTPHFPE